MIEGWGNKDLMFGQWRLLPALGRCSLRRVLEDTIKMGIGNFAAYIGGGKG
jgi:hypothetical protein